MQVKFQTFPVGSGDCITLLLKNGDKEMHIMVDCGLYKPEVNDYIKNEFHGHIDYLIVTHIDNDHISGVIEMLKSTPNLTINRIFYNCYQRTTDDLQEWDEKMVENMKRVYGHLPVVVDMLEQKIKAETSMTLAELILENENWKRAWRREYITENSLAIDLENDMGRFIFLSPTKKALDDLDKEYRTLFWKTLYKQKKEDYKKEETIYESLMRIIEQEDNEGLDEEPVSSKVLDENALKFYADEKMKGLSPANEASIAFIWEHKEHRILFMGDANPNLVVKKIGDVYKDTPKPVLFDAIKISHHGSAHSTSKELVSVADSERYFVTGGASARPSYQALSRIIIAPLPEDLSHREIRYNRENDILKSLASNESLKDKLHYSITANANEYEVSY